MKEFWKDIIGYEGKYQISNLGRVMSTFKGGILKPINNEGYLKVILCNNGKKSFFIHRLVATHFIPNPENKQEVNHKKGIKNDNRASELEWSTRSENCTHAIRTGLKVQLSGEQCSWAKINQSQADEIKAKYKSGNYSTRKLAKEYNLSQTHVGEIIRNVCWRN
jgi:hypothetical protein